MAMACPPIWLPRVLVISVETKGGEVLGTFATYYEEARGTRMLDPRFDFCVGRTAAGISPPKGDLKPPLELRSVGQSVELCGADALRTAQSRSPLSREIADERLTLSELRRSRHR